MSYQIELVNKNTLSHIKLVEVVNEPSIKEEINGEYSLNFEAHYESKSDLNANVLVKVNEQLYQIKKLTKNRSNSITLSVQCEHISYELIVEGDYEDDWEIESTAEGMLNSILSGTRFTLGDCISTNYAYYRTKTRDKRQQLMDIANLFGGELYFDNFTVHLVHQRGSDKGLDIKLGVNLLGVTEEIDFVEGTTAYELDLVDLSRVNGYELDFTSAEIGDTIGISDDVLGINTNERIIAIEYNPFRRQLPTVTVGQYMRDFTEYLKDEEESTLKTNETWLEVFSIGETNVLYLDDLDAGGAVVEIHEKAPVVTIQVKQEHIGDTISLNLFDSSGNQYSNYNEHAFDLNGRLIIEGDFPRGTSGAVEVIITSKSTGEERKYFVNVEDLTADSFEDYWLESLLVGNEECIYLDGLNISNGGEGADLFMENKVDTITIKVKEEYKTYVKAVSIYNDSNVIVYTRGSSHFDANGQVIIKREFPMTDKGSIKIAVMHPVTKAKQSFLVGVSIGENPVETNSELSEFRVGTVDCLALGYIDCTSSALNYINGTSETIKANTVYEVFSPETGVVVSLNEEYKNHYITIFATVFMYGSEVTEVIEYDPGIFGSMEIPAMGMGPDGEMIKLDYTHIGVIISKLPFNEITPSSFVKAYGVHFVLSEEQVETGGIKYAFVGSKNEPFRGLNCVSLKFITNITNFRDDFMNDVTFETSSETNELYPVSYYSSVDWGDLVQVVDGVVTSVLNNKNIS